MLPGNARGGGKRGSVANIARFWNRLDYSHWDFGRYSYHNYNVTLAAIGGEAVEIAHNIRDDWQRQRRTA